MKKLLIVLMFAYAVLLSGCASTKSSGGGGGNGPTLNSIQITPNSPSVAAGSGTQLKATGSYSDGSSQDITSTATWTSSATSVATVSSSGMASGVAAGTATIKAALSGVNGTVTLTVTSPTITALTVSPTSKTIAENTTFQFTANATYSDGSSGNATGQVTWTSSNTGVASINVNGASGLTKGLTAGSSTIKAASGSVSATATLTVTGATLVSIAVTPTTASMPLGTAQQFTATGTFNDGSTQDITGSVTWSSSNTSVASIAVSGLATAKNLGSATITATSGSISATASVTVNADDLVSLAIQPANPTIAATTNEQFSAIGTFNNGSTRNLTSQSTWTSDTPGVATIGSTTGLAKGKAAGSSNIGATFGSFNATTVLTVSNATLSSISVTPAGDTIAPGTQLQFTATGTFSDGSTQVITNSVTWASDKTSVATIGAAGSATAVAQGTANISATQNSVTGSAALNVSSVTLKSIAVTPATAALAPATTQQYTATGTFSDGSMQILTGTVTWSSSNTSVATISSFGLVTGQSAGQSTITAKSGSVSGTAAVVVEASQLTGIQVTPVAATVAEKTGIQFTAIGNFADGSTQNLTGSASWSSAPSSVATVGDSTLTKGFATGVSPGSATITALFAGQSGSSSLTVTNATLTTITVSPNDPSVAAGGSVQFTATGTFSDGSTENLSTQVTWSSSNVNVASVNGSGLATTAASGTSTISASMFGVKGTTVLTVQ
jgi:trimeric autotransporter adhesin